MMDKSDCNTCHQLDKPSVGPTYLDISRRYATRVDAVEYLSRRIIEGGGGVWGETAMAAHPALSEGAAAQMAKYILSLTNADRLAPSLPLKGTLHFDRHRPDEINGTYLLAVTYTDKGGDRVGPLTAREVLTFRQPFLPAVNFSAIQGAMKFKLQGGTMPGIEEDMEFVIGNNDSYVAYDNVDLTGVGELVLGIGQAANYFGGGTMEVRTGSPDGPLLGSLEVHQGLTDIGFSELKLPIGAVTGRQQLVVRFLGKDAQKPVCALVYLKFLPVSG
ncbi:MAG: carbohydrate-binding protein [Bacteroidetes bacterium]|nr:MAG: carbohydrate-binding protein [Bacteroidota bacterium]